jgi:hypothetical protein
MAASLLPLLRDGKADWRDHFFFEHYTAPSPVLYIPRNEGIRTIGEKYLRWLNWDMSVLAEEFYNLETDPEEMENLALNPEYQSGFERYRTWFEQWRESNPSNFNFYPYSGRPQFGAREIDWERFKQVRPDEFSRIQREVERLGVTWEQAMNDWEIRYQISSRAGYWY